MIYSAVIWNCGERVGWDGVFTVLERGDMELNRGGDVTVTQDWSKLILPCLSDTPCARATLCGLYEKACLADNSWQVISFKYLLTIF